MKTEFSPQVQALLDKIGEPLFDKTTSSSSTLPSSDVGFPDPALFMEAPDNGWNKRDAFGTYFSLREFLAHAGKKDDAPSGINVLIVSPVHQVAKWLTVRIDRGAFDVYGSIQTLTAYYEGREKLPTGFTHNAIGWLGNEVVRYFYFNPEISAQEDAQVAADLFRDALISIADVDQVPLLRNLFDYESDVFPYQVNDPNAGLVTRMFAREVCLPTGNHYNEQLARMFEIRMRELLRQCFLRQWSERIFGRKMEDGPDLQTGLALPLPAFPGAFMCLEGNLDISQPNE